MKQLYIKLTSASDVWKEQYGDDTLMSVRIGEEDEGRLHYASALVSRENALILRAAGDLYRAVAAEFDFITPCDEATKLAMDALDKAQGAPIGARWEAYRKRYAK